MIETCYSKEIIPLEGWSREETFRFFSQFPNPFFNVHTEVELTPLYNMCKSQKLSLSLAYMHATLQAARATENLLYRVEQGQVVKYNGVDISSTVLRDDHNISFTHFPYHPNLQDFCQEGSAIIAEARKSRKLFFGYSGNDVLHATTLPWFTYKGMEHALPLSQDEPGIPKFGFGKMEMRDYKVYLPLSIGLHHGLADGYHMHLFIENLNKTINQY